MSQRPLSPKEFLLAVASGRKCFDSVLTTSSMVSGRRRSFSTKAALSCKAPESSAMCMASSTKIKEVEEKTFVDATPSSVPARAAMCASHSVAMVDLSWFTIPMVKMSAASFDALTLRTPSTASPVSPELDTTMSTSPAFRRGFLYRNSEAICTSTGILAICSMRYSPSRATFQEEPAPMIMILLVKPPSALLQARSTSEALLPPHRPSGSGACRLGIFTLPLSSR
mmetsp:Transcript_63255/g.150880  ORF Transcript_63255/g.150880 Transcript_63255/m.150880 type:complete len:226 (-) Transcript_63255:215-892(-)